MNNDEFYIGWMPAAPSRLTKRVRKIIAGIGGSVLAAGLVLSLGQKKFSTSTFEFGTPTEVKGVYHSLPVPSLKVVSKADMYGRSATITMPLVGYGKFGAEGVMDKLEKENNLSLDNKEVTLKGTLLYSDGKTLLQVDSHDQPLVRVGKTDPSSSVQGKDLGLVSLNGEILDPKCYFGVMKPGHGKPHRDCAIRCIAGGINPVFYTRSSYGETSYYLILDEHGKKMNDQLRNYVAEPVLLEAKAVQYDDWIVLYTKKESIKRTGGLSFFKSKEASISCGPR
jgi:hypothetical protein